MINGEEVLVVLKSIYTNEFFWLVASFVVMVIALYKPVKKSVNEALNKGIEEIESELLDAMKAKTEAQALIEELITEYQEVLIRAKDIIYSAKKEAEQSIEQTQKRVIQISERHQKIMMEDRLKQEEELFNKFKGEVLVSVMTMIENDMISKLSRDKRGGGVEYNSKMFKKIWN